MIIFIGDISTGCAGRRSIGADSNTFANSGSKLILSLTFLISSSELFVITIFLNTGT